MIRLSAEHLAIIAEAAEMAYPFECCGLLVGRGRRVIEVTRLVPAPNLLVGEALDRFELDPRIRFETERSVRGSSERIVGHWHSHPNGSALPSATDLAQAWEPDLVWLIVGVGSLSNGRPQTIQILAHRLNRDTGRIRAVRLGLAEKSACKPSMFPT
jgi:proteasome lid subunit RPN8/RPN11